MLKKSWGAAVRAEYEVSIFLVSVRFQTLLPSACLSTGCSLLCLAGLVELVASAGCDSLTQCTSLPISDSSRGLRKHLSVDSSV